MTTKTTTYKCGNRYCNEDELDIIEKVRSGKLKTVEPGGEAGVDLSSLKAKIEELAGSKVDTAGVAAAISEELGKRPIQIIDFDGFLAHQQGCPECQSKFHSYLDSILPGFAESHGYAAAKAEAAKEKAAAAPTEKEKPSEKKEPSFLAKIYGEKEEG